MNRNNRIPHYTRIARTQGEAIKKLSKQIYLTGTIRLLVFIVGATLIYLFHKNIQLVVALLIVTGIVFFLLLKHSDRLLKKRKYAQALQKICKNELKTFQYDYSAFDGAAEKIDPTHDFSFDLDVFGENSLFQLINRSTLRLGKEKLSAFFQYPLRDKQKIEARQAAVKELAEKEAFCLHFRATGSCCDDIFPTENDVKKTFATPSLFKHFTLWKALCKAVPLVYLVYISLAISGVLSTSYFLYLYLATFAISAIPSKAIKRIRTNFNKRAKALGAYGELFKTIETESFNSNLLKGTNRELVHKTPASNAIKKLTNYCHNLDLSFTAAILFLNPIFLWNVRYALRIEQWMRNYAHRPEAWFLALAEMDAFISLGTFAQNHPDYSYPTLSDTFCIEGTEVGHPIIPRERCVKNDISITRKPFFMIITGANMAGKSTYLRTIGINHLLACVGLPVCASKFRLSPGRLLTNLRTADSLVNNESYFFAELKRLQMIVQSLESGTEELFIILDEILKGTNSEDKQKGSFALMKRLVHLNGNGIIATHDLALGALENEFPNEIKNFHFDANISNDTLSFTYKLQRGIAQNMNASFLMKKMGIV